jgi:hypothetical protein
MLRHFVPACLINPHLVNNTLLSPSDYRTAAYLCQPLLKPWQYGVHSSYNCYSRHALPNLLPSQDRRAYSLNFVGDVFSEVGEPRPAAASEPSLGSPRTGRLI